MATASDAKLTNFMNANASIGSIRGVTVTNPVGMTVLQPGVNAKFEVVVSVTEPGGSPATINLLWVRLDETLQPIEVLKLKSTERPAVSEVAGAVRGFNQSWVRVESGEDIFSDPQYTNVQTFQGVKGDKGNKGDKGPKGDTPVIDYTRIIDEVKIALRNRLASIQIIGADEVQGGTSTNYTIEATMGDASKLVPSPSPSDVVWSVKPSGLGSIVNGTFTAHEFNNTRSGTIRASYTYRGITRTDTLSINVTNVQSAASNIVSLEISTTTPNKHIFEGGDVEQFICTATYEDQTTKVIHADDPDLEGTLVWAVSAALGVFDQTAGNDGMFTAKNVTTNAGPGNVKVTYNPTLEGAANITDLYNIRVNVNSGAVTLDYIEITGASTVSSGAEASYSAIGHYSNGSTANLTSGLTWDTSGGIGTIDNAGNLTATTITNGIDITGGAVTVSHASGATGTLNVDIVSQVFIDHIEVYRVSGPTLGQLNVGETVTFGARYYVNPGDTGTTGAVNITSGMGTLVWSINDNAFAGDLVNNVFSPTQVGTGLVVTATFTPSPSQFGNTSDVTGSTVTFNVDAAPQVDVVYYGTVQQALVTPGSAATTTFVNPPADLAAFITGNLTQLANVSNESSIEIPGNSYFRVPAVSGNFETFIFVALPASFETTYSSILLGVEGSMTSTSGLNGPMTMIASGIMIGATSYNLYTPGTADDFVVNPFISRLAIS
jgi:hypothetical protein